MSFQIKHNSDHNDLCSSCDNRKDVSFKDGNSLRFCNGFDSMFPLRDDKQVTHCSSHSNYSHVSAYDAWQIVTDEEGRFVKFTHRSVQGTNLIADQEETKSMSFIERLRFLFRGND